MRTKKSVALASLRWSDVNPCTDLPQRNLGNNSESLNEHGRGRGKWRDACGVSVGDGDGVAVVGGGGVGRGGRNEEKPLQDALEWSGSEEGLEGRKTGRMGEGARRVSRARQLVKPLHRLLIP